MTVVFDNVWDVNPVNDQTTGWLGTNAYTVNLGPTNLSLLDPPLHGYKKAADYEIQFSNTVVDTSTAGPFPYDVPIADSVQDFQPTDSTYVKFLLPERHIPRTARAAGTAGRDHPDGKESAGRSLPDMGDFLPCCETR